jgi:hypothetical protein
VSLHLLHRNFTVPSNHHRSRREKKNNALAAPSVAKKRKKIKQIDGPAVKKKQCTCSTLCR